MQIEMNANRTIKHDWFGLILLAIRFANRVDKKQFFLIGSELIIHVNSMIAEVLFLVQIIEYKFHKENTCQVLL